MLPYWESSVCPLANFDPSKDTFFDIGGRSISGEEPEIIVQSGQYDRRIRVCREYRSDEP